LKSGKSKRKKSLADYSRVHFIGIGGIGMSALARLMKSRDKIVTGSDVSQSAITKSLNKEGIAVSIGHSEKNLADDVDCVVYTLAISSDNPELLKAGEKNLSVFTYAGMLGLVSGDSKTIAVSGTHGKTTTTAMINSALRAAGIKPNVIVGSLLSGDETNFLPGEGESKKIFLTEACEYKKSFLNLKPSILVITNIEEDHLDFYRDLADIKGAFMEMADKVPARGKIVCDFNDANVEEIVKKYEKKCLNTRDFLSAVPELKVPGEHNRRNAACALAVAKILKVDLKKAQRGLANFCGTWRRLEPRGKNKRGAIIYDDYGHHPTEITASLEALRQKYPGKKIVVFFQPHLYSRTKTLFGGFVAVLKKFDKVYLLPIYAAREPNDPSISSEKIAGRVPGAEVLENFDTARKKLAEIEKDRLILTLGAGDVYLILE